MLYCKHYSLFVRMETPSPKPEQQTPPTATPVTPAAPQPTDTDAKANALLAALCYIPVIGVIMLFVKTDSPFVTFHAKQGTALSIGFIIVSILNSFWIFWVFTWILWVLLVVVGLIGFFKALAGQKYRLPILGDLADQFNFGPKA